jgi:hypothetical protein
MDANLLIALPVHGGNVKVQCAISLVALCSTLVANDIRFEIRSTGSADIAKNRNFLASLAFAQSERTHLLFVDSDMDFRPEAVVRLLGLAKPVAGCVYPKRQSPAGIEDFVVDLSGQPKLEVLDGACRVTGIGMGLCLIQRTALAQLTDTKALRCAPADPRRGETFHGLVYGFFDPMIGQHQYISEDFSFCRRWTSLCGGEVWALIDQDIGHIGETTYRGRLEDFFRSRKSEAQTLRQQQTSDP